MEFNNNYYERVAGEINRAIKKLKKEVYTVVTPLDIKGFVTKEPVLFSERLNYHLTNFKIGQSWGKLFDCAWFNLTCQIPEFRTDLSYYLLLDFNGELLLYNSSGLPLKGFTNVTSVFDRALGEPGKTTYPISKLISNSGTLDLWVEGGCNDLFGFYQDHARIVDCYVCTKDERKEKLYYDLEFLLDLMKSLPREGKEFKKLYKALKDTCPLILYSDPNYIDKISVRIAPFLQESSNNNITVSAVGHCHMDLAWLWPIRETKRKILRNLSNTIYLLEKYPQYIFGISQPQQLAWVKESSPSLFAKVKEYILQGRIEPQGGMWVEADTNVPSGESLVRQMLYGINYWQAEFGKRVRNLWLPDVFGYNGNLPLIMKQSGLDYFMTIKLCWNLNNVFPHKSFIWQGINGDKVLAHMPPEGTYNSPILPSSLLKAVKNYPEIKLSPKLLSAYGIGDGGGGPGEEHLERISRINKVSKLPQVKLESSESFFNSLQEYQDLLPTWQGELYLENHQGTYTSAMTNKYFNHLLEEKLKAAEIYLVHKGEYNHQAQIDELWKEILLYQFHDILPGSSIMRVYDETTLRYNLISKKIDELVTGNNKPNTIFNHNLQSGVYFKPSGNKILNYELSPLSISEPKKIGLARRDITTTDTTIKMNNLTVVVSHETGFIQSIYDTKNKNLLSKLGTRICGYLDYGNGWDIKDNYRLQDPVLPQLITQEHLVYSNGYEAIVNHYHIFGSTITEQIIFSLKNNLIMYHHDADFKDLEKMIRFETNTAFSSKINTYGIQFGHLTRSTSNNSTIDEAQYEVPAQRWAASFNQNKGLAIIAGDRYGYYGKNNVLDINLLRSSTYPGKKLGIGKHSYSFYLLPMTNGFNKELIEHTSQLFTTTYLNVACFKTKPLITVSNENIYLSTLKPSIQKDGVIVRLANFLSTPQIFKLTTTIPYQLAFTTTTAEEDIKEIDLQDNLELKPFSFITIKLKTYA